MLSRLQDEQQGADVGMLVVKRRSVVAGIIALILLSIAIRYPLVSHERYQTDSYFIHTLSSSIVDEGYAVWTVNPLSYVGYYPLSYPSGMPFVISELSIMTGTDIELSILLSCFVFGVLFCVIVFCLARMFLKNNMATLIAVTFAVIAPRFVDTTYWNGSARAPAVTLMLLVLLLSFRFRSDYRFIFSGLSMLIAFVVLTMHHMMILLVFFLMAYVVAVVGTRFLRTISVSSYRRAYIVASTVAGILAIAAFLKIFHVLGRLVVQTYGGDGILDPSLGTLATIGNMGISYTHQIGLVLPVAAIGYFWYIWREKSWASIHYPFAVLVTFMPLIGYGLYMSLLLAPFVAVLFAFVVAEHRRMRPRAGATRAVRTAVVVLLVLSLVSMVISVDRWNDSRYNTGDEVEVPNQVFTDAIYVSSNFDREFAVFNQPVMASEFVAIGGVYSIGASGVTSMLSGDVTPEMIDGNITRSWVSFPLSVYLIYSYKYDYVGRGYVGRLMTDGLSYVQTLSEAPYPTATSEYSDSHSRFLVIIDNSWSEDYVTHYSIDDSVFLSEVRDSASYPEVDSLHFVSYSVYQSEGISQYAVAFDI